MFTKSRFSQYFSTLSLSLKQKLYRLHRKLCDKSSRTNE